MEIMGINISHVGAYAVGFFVAGMGIYSTLLFRAEVRRLKKIAQEICQHKNTHTYIEDVTPCCEKVKVTCLDCDKVISNKTDCR